MGIVALSFKTEVIIFLKQMISGIDNFHSFLNAIGFD